MPVTEEYQVKVRQCPLDIRSGGASENNRDIVFVDWRPILHPDEPNYALSACEFMLGFDPTSDATSEQEKWLDEELRFAPAPVWARSEPYIQALESKVAQLEGGAVPKK